MSLESRARESRQADAAVVAHGRACEACRQGLCAEMMRLVDVAAGLAMYQSLWAEEQDDRRELVRRVMRMERERVAKMFGSEWSPPFTEDDVDAVLARAATAPR